MAFHEVRFPANLSFGSVGGPERRTQIVELASGDEERNASWANSRRRYDVAYGIRRADDLAAVGHPAAPADLHVAELPGRHERVDCGPGDRQQHVTDRSHHPDREKSSATRSGTVRCHRQY